MVTKEFAGAKISGSYIAVVAKDESEGDHISIWDIKTGKIIKYPAIINTKKMISSIFQGFFLIDDDLVLYVI